MSEEQGGLQAGPGIGRRLEQAREQRGLSLRQVEEATKIRARYLEALERGNFHVLPTVYVLGSLKTYADFLGLDGAALSRELRGGLEPDEPEISGAADPSETDDEREAAPVMSIGFDHLFVGMGVLIFSVLAIMTLVSAAARYEEPKISQLDETSVQDAPPEMALAGNVDPKTTPEPGEAKEPGKADKVETKASRDDNPEPQKEDEKPQEDEKTEEASSTTSLFGDVEFVPMSPSSPSETSYSTASASASVASASASASAFASAPVASASAEPAAASPESSVASPEPQVADAEPSASASATLGSVAPLATNAEPDYASASPAPASGRPARPAAASGTGPSPVADLPLEGGTFGGSLGGGIVRPGGVADAGRSSAGVNETLNEALPDRR